MFRSMVVKKEVVMNYWDWMQENLKVSQCVTSARVQPVKQINICRSHDLTFGLKLYENRRGYFNCRWPGVFLVLRTHNIKDIAGMNYVEICVVFVVYCLTIVASRHRLLTFVNRLRSTPRRDFLLDTMQTRLFAFCAMKTLLICHFYTLYWSLLSLT